MAIVCGQLTLAAKIIRVAMCGLRRRAHLLKLSQALAGMTC